MSVNRLDLVSGQLVQFFSFTQPMSAHREKYLDTDRYAQYRESLYRREKTGEAYSRQSDRCCRRAEEAGGGGAGWGLVGVGEGAGGVSGLGGVAKCGAGTV